MRASDGRGEPTVLLAALQSALAAASTDQLIERVYAPETTRERLAQLATAVFAATASDSVAARILQQAAADLAELVSTLAQRLNLAGEQFPLALAGSVPPLANSRADARVFAALRPQPVSLIAEPVAGALALARRLSTS
jgi:N-acetylglucosamine kinase-like BadF-type ATPase